jgi:hypothetical protein
MEKPSFYDLSASTYEFNDPLTSTSDHELHFHIMGMVQDRPFFGAINEDPYFHLEELEKLCSRLVRGHLYRAVAPTGTNASRLYRVVARHGINVLASHLYRVELPPGTNVKPFVLGASSP